MAEASLTTPYSTASPYTSGSLADWVDEYSAQRLAAYSLYDDLYYNAPGTYKLLLRGSDDAPVYVPTAKRLINTFARYVGRNWGFSVLPALDPATGAVPVDSDGAPVIGPEELLAMSTFSDLFTRENMLGKFESGNRECLRRGDWVWYLSADPDKAEGSRISVESIDPSTYFPLTSDANINRLSGAMIVEQYVLDDDETVVVKVQRWLKPIHPDHPGYVPDGPASATEIAYDCTAYEVDSWSDPDERVQVAVPWAVALEILPGILTVPLYHIRNAHTSGDPFGRSELSGVESLFVAINQAATDEDFALAMAGLGMYETDSGAPVDQDGNPTDWVLGPNRVVEVGNGKHFKRVPGVSSVDPSQSHIAYLEESAYGASGINEIALGSRGSVTESGIALSIRMQPLFDEADSRDKEINSVLSQMFHDLKTWFSVYEGVNLGEVRIISTTDTTDRIPFDRKARWEELVNGYSAGIFALDFVHKILVEDFGYDLAPADLAAALESQAKRAEQADPYASRAAGELSASDGNA